ncbi:DUF6199 family natural product biosynthesis protein [Bacillus sp. EAC]|uniref:DUF6199 family natural product biosynthesis protein n=1 Tax=Bacillus sp. EAC TaxID=1978338 RepID=UPI000B4327B2|nr:DUF6199 family natural product biosynthesis protein [Bacillus sp. EAC]
MVLFAFIFIILGIIGTFFPKVSWYISEGWKFKGAEPSTAALIIARLGGVISIIMGFYLLTS